MITVSSREFRANQKAYLDKISRGGELMLTRRNEVFKIVKVTDDDTLINKADFLAQINHAIKDVKNGKTLTMEKDESLADFLDRVKEEQHV